MKILSNTKDIREASKSSRCCIIVGTDDCLHCHVAKNVLEGIEKEYPLIDFVYTESKDYARSRNIDSYPTLCFFENGSLSGTLIGTNHIVQIKEMLNVWFLKE